MLKVKSDHTKNHLQLGPGLIFRDFDISVHDNAASLKKEIDRMLSDDTVFIGATKNGVTFRAIPNLRTYYEDISVFAPTNSTIDIGWDIELSAALVEFTPHVLANLFPSAVVDRRLGKVKTIDVAGTSESSRRKNIVWIGFISRGDYMAIELKNAIGVGGITFVSENEGENEIRVRFMPRAGEYNNKHEQPFHIYFIGKQNEKV